MVSVRAPPVIDGIGEQMKVRPVAKRNTLHEMNRKGRLYICFKKDKKGEFSIRLKPPCIQNYVHPRTMLCVASKVTMESTMKKEIMQAHYHEKRVEPGGKPGWAM